MKPQIKLRGAYDNKKQHDNLIKQLKDRQQEFKTKINNLNLKTNSPKKFGIGKETVGSSNFLKNRFSDAKNDNQLDQPSEPEENHTKEETKNLATTQQTPKGTPIPVIVINSSTASSTKTENHDQDKIIVQPNIETTTKRIEGLQKIREKQKEAVFKIKDRISLGKSKNKN